MNIETKNLTLKHNCALLSSHVGWLNDKELMKYSEQRHREHTVDSQLQYINSFDQVDSFWWEISPHNMAPIGSITAYVDLNNGIADLGIMIGVFQMRGYGTEAWQAVCDWLFTGGAIRKIEAGCMASNAAMIKIFGRTGMVIEGRRRAHFLLDGKPEDLILAAKLP